MEKFKKFFLDRKSTILLVNITLFILIIYLCILTSSLWRGMFSVILKIIMPFIIGLIIAYFLAPLTNWLRKRGVRKSLAITLTLGLVITVIVLIIIFIGPQLYKLFNDFYIQYVTEFDYGIIDYFKAHIGFDLTPLYDYFVSWLGDTVAEFGQYAVLNLPSIINRVISAVVTMIFGIAVALYLLSDDGKIKNNIYSFSNKISKNATIYINTVDHDLRLYLGGMMLIAIERFIEYCIIYAILGSSHFLILALIHGIGVFVPYIGGLIGSIFGVISLLLAHNGNWSLILICFAVLIFFQYFDEYFVAPKILSRSTKINPLWIIFAFFAGSILLGPIGVLISVPTFIAISVCIKTYFRLKTMPKESPPEVGEEKIETVE